jgi:Arc/MetJ-type ribon-helix-helix transcriptional regulator
MPVETERVTLRLPVTDLLALDSFVESGQYMHRSDVIRDAIRDFIRSRASEVEAGVNAHKKLLESASAAQQLKAMRELVMAKMDEQFEELKKSLK